MNDFTVAIVEVLRDKELMAHYPEGIAPVEILDEVQTKYPGEFLLCTVIDVCHEKDAVYEVLHA
jgi:hypothetical protein